MFSRVFASLGAKNTVNTNVFWRVGKPKTTVFTMFFASGSKKHGIYSVFWPAPSKNTGILRRFHHVAKCGFLIRKEQKYCKLQYFESALRVRGRCGGGGWGGTKMTSNLLKNQVTGLAALPFTS